MVASAALAAPPVLIPGSPLVAGVPGQVDLWAPDLPADTTVRARAKGGHAGEVQRLDDGRLRVPVEPSSEGRFELFLALSGPGGKDSGRYALDVQPPMAGGLSIEAVPSEAVAGGGPVELLVRPVSADPRIPTDRRLLTRASLGQLVGPQAADRGWALRYTPPARLTEPAFAIITVADAAAPAVTPGWAVVPVSMPTALRFPYEAGATCTLVVGEQRFGPVVADAAGTLEVPLNLPPGRSRGELECEHQGQSLRRTVALPSGQEPTVALLPLPPRVTAGAQVVITMVVLESDGTPRSVGTAPTVQASAGRAGRAEMVGVGLASVIWTAPSEPGRAQLSASLLGSEVNGEIEVVAAAAELRLSQQSLALPAGQREAKLSANGPVAALLGESAALKGRISSGAESSLTVRLADKKSQGSFAVAGPSSTSLLAPAAILGWADTPVLPAGHRDAVSVTLLVVDEYGLPLPGLTLALGADKGKVAASLRTDAQGRGRIQLTPQSDGVVTLTVQHAGLSASVPLLVGLGGAGLADAPGTGTLRDHVLRERARASMPGGVLVASGTPTSGSGSAPAPIASAAMPDLPEPAAPTARTARQIVGTAGATSMTEASAPRRGSSADQEDAPSETRRSPFVAVSAATVPHSYGSSSSGLHGLPSSVSADQGDLLRGKPVGAPAGMIRVGVPLWKSVSWDTRLAARYEGYVVRETGFTRLDLQGASGLKFGMASQSQGRPYLLAQAEYARVPIFSYARFREEDPDKATGARMLIASVAGARLGGGFELDVGPLLIRLEGSETLAPWPIHTRGEADFAWRLTETIALRTGLELGFRSMRFDLGQDMVRVTDQQHAMSLGVVFGPL